jgi:STE24 endopeptidase
VDRERTIGCAALGLIAARWLAQLALERLNERHARAHAGTVPQEFRAVMDDATYARSIDYTLAGSRLAYLEHTFEVLLLVIVLFSGVLPWAWAGFDHHSVVSAAVFLFINLAALSCLSLPLQWWHQFRLEQRFGFNTTTQGTWWFDRLKGFLLAAVIGFPLLLLVLRVIGWMGSLWWVGVWALMLTLQLLMSVLAPVLILPLFNKFIALPEGSLRERLLALAKRTNFRAASVQVMDGSRRSRHSNAFFTGFGRFRRIVLFDTLIAQLGEPELEAVLAHEIGHWRRRHIAQRLVVSAAGSLAALGAAAWISALPSFGAAFGFLTGLDQPYTPTTAAPRLLLCVLLSGPVLFWLSPLLHGWSRRHEYEADAYAKRVIGTSGPLITALRKLNEKNLSNLTPHPLYSGFFYSHPTLLERERALERA